MAETELKGKVALITGAGSGIGQAAAWALARRGVSVALAGRDENKLLETAAQIGYEGGDAVALVADVTDPAQVTRLVTETTRAFDGLDILVNSAGVGLIKPLETTTADEIDRLLSVNVKGTMLTTQAAVRAMIAGGRGGHIINLAGILGKAPMANASLYCASKYAVTGFSKALQLEVKRHAIKVSLMYLGGVDTPFWDGLDMKLQRDKMLSAEDAANAIITVLTQPAHLVLGEFVLQPESHQL
ncbi:MAG: SDR family oxidoreductase [Armatimonadota bacterium]|nr:SDR family oxidoreductase [Armatimonadota bacterium]